MLYCKPCRCLWERGCAIVRAKEIAEDISCLHTEKYTGAQVLFYLFFIKCRNYLIAIQPRRKNNRIDYILILGYYIE